MAGRTVMVTTFLRDGNLAAVDPAVVRYLNRSGIDRVVVGHKPWGDSPGTVRCGSRCCGCLCFVLFEGRFFGQMRAF